VSWQTKIVTYVRGITDDLGSSQINSDEKLEQLIVIAAMQVVIEVDFSTDYVMDVEDITISPDPSNDTPFVNLVSMKTACMLARADQKNQARKAYALKDGPTNIDGRAPSEQTSRWADNICQEYAKAVLDYKLGNLQPGKAIIGPYQFDGTDNYPYTPNMNRLPLTDYPYFN